jgi:hypothetical protein
MIRAGALPLGQQIAIALFAPPIITAVWWLLSGGWSGLMGTTQSDVVKSWRKPALWTVLIVCYVLMFGITAFAYFF